MHKTNDPEVLSILEQRVYSALRTYSNVHRGSGHFSLVTTHLFDQARNIVLEYCGLKPGRFVVIFCTPRRAMALKAKLKNGTFRILSSQDIGLSIGIRAVVIEKQSLPKGNPLESGGGTTRLISKDWVIWAGSPDKFEAGTPSVIHVITFANALKLAKTHGIASFGNFSGKNYSMHDILFSGDDETLTGKVLLEKIRKSTIGSDVVVPTSYGLKPFINFDNAASTSAFEPVWNAARRSWILSCEDRKVIADEVKTICSSFLHAPLSSYDIMFTSNTTEAINLASEGMGLIMADEMEPVVMNTLLEHNSNDLPWRLAPELSVVRAGINDAGLVDTEEMERLLMDYNSRHDHGKKRICLIAVCGASNVLGICNDLEAISKVAHKYGANILVDGAQLISHREVNIEKSGIDFLAFSAHKAYAPFGTGVLIARKGLLKFSDSQMEDILSSGEENTAGIAALGKSMILLQRIGMDIIKDEEQALTARLLDGFRKIPGLTVYGVNDPGSPDFEHKAGVIAFGFKTLMGNIIAKKLALDAGIGCRYGCHCAHTLVKHILHVSPRLERFQRIMITLFPNIRLPGVARVSFGIGNSFEETDILIAHLKGMLIGQAPDDRDTISEVSGGPKRISLKDLNNQMDEFILTTSEKVFGS